METYLDNIDVEKVETILKSTEQNVKYFNDTCDKVVKSYSSSLDSLMKDLYVDCVMNKNPSIETLEQYYLELSNMIYFMIEKLEQLGVYADMSESASKEVYSKAYLDLSLDKDEKGKSKATVAELQAKASVSSQYESVVSSIYERAYKIVKGKVTSAQDMVNTLRRILSTRTSEMQLTIAGPNRVGGDE